MTFAELVPLLAAAAVGYLVGSIPFPYLAVRLKTGRDIRDVHTGNVGVMNSMSLLGRYVGGGVALLELAKGFAATWLGLQIAGDYGAWIALLMAVSGANWPVWLRFDGGRGNTTLAGGLIYKAPVLLATIFVVWFLCRAITGSAFLATRLNMILMPVYFGGFAFLRGDPVENVLLFAAAGAIVGLIFRTKHSRETDDHMALKEAGRLPGLGGDDDDDALTAGIAHSSVL